MFVILGATGNTGRVAARQLLAAGRNVRAVGRSAERLRALQAAGADAMAGDARDAAFLARAFAGAEGVYAMIPPDYSQPDPRAYYNLVGDAIAAGLRAAGVPRVAFLSSLGGELPVGTGPILGLHDVEEKLRSLGTGLVILRPGYFYENFYASLPLIKTAGVNGGAIEPDVPIPMTATRDIGAAAAEELLGGEFGGASVRELLGPRDYTMREATRLLGEAIGKPDLAYVRFPDADAAAGLQQAGISSGVAATFIEMAHALSSGLVWSHQGRTPRTTMPTPFEAFAKELAAAWA